MAKKPLTTDLASAFGTQSSINDSWDAIDVAFDNTLSLDGSTPNTMTADLDMGSQDIINADSITTNSLKLNGLGVTPLSIAATPAASAITVADAGSFYVSSDVEAALQEAALAATITIADAGGYYTATDVEAALQEAALAATVTLADSGGYYTAANIEAALSEIYLARKYHWISTTTLSADTYADFTGFDNTFFNSYVFRLYNVRPTTDASVLRIRTSSNGGTSYSGGITDYAYSVDVNSEGAQSSIGTATTSDISLTNTGVGNLSHEDGYSGVIDVLNASDTNRKTIIRHSGLAESETGVHRSYFGHGIRLQQSEVNALRIYFSAGTLATGKIVMYGIRDV